jgi:hypothetical protein
MSQLELDRRDCSICQQEIVENAEPLIALHCMHVYHAECISTYADVESINPGDILRKLRCPDCRKSGDDFTTVVLDEIPLGQVAQDTHPDVEEPPLQVTQPSSPLGQPAPPTVDYSPLLSPLVLPPSPIVAAAPPLSQASLVAPSPIPIATAASLLSQALAQPRSAPLGPPSSVVEVPTISNAPPGYVYCETCGRHELFERCRVLRKGDCSFRCSGCRTHALENVWAHTQHIFGIKTLEHSKQHH